MKATELRIGNLIYNGVKVIDVKAGALVSMVSNSQDQVVPEFKPIPLTEEWLEKFGGGKDEDGVVCIDNPTNYCSFYLIDGYIKQFKGVTPISEYKHIKYVHSLQNLYFALTGEELKYEEKSSKK